ncbi:autotransporter outer membrane beta-barrel domain-containing protein [Campylobacter jejuni]|nr:autotransporter outer membrane beta-barrel domain-containing protein [Campylobacter jejuni]
MGGGFSHSQNQVFLGIKPKFISLVALSVLSSSTLYANGIWQPTNSGTGCEVGSGNECTVISTINNGLQTSTTGQIQNLIISLEGKVTPSTDIVAVNAGKNTTIDTIQNNGTIIGGSNKASVNIGENGTSGGGSTITNFINNGMIGNGTSKYGITVWGTTNNKSSITNFTNSGTISSLKDGVYLGNTVITNFTNSGSLISSSGVALNIKDGTSITKLENSGTISGSNGISIEKNVNISNLYNTGTIIGSENGVFFNKGEAGENKIETFVNTGYIKGGSQTSSYYPLQQNSGVMFSNKGVKTFENKGTIEGAAGILFTDSDMDSFINSGTIKATGNGGKFSDGIVLSIYGNDVQSIDIETFENSGFIYSEHGDGIKIHEDVKIGTFINRGTIEAKNNGFSLEGFGSGQPGSTTIGKFINESGSKIIGGANGIVIPDKSSSNVDLGEMEIKGEVEGSSGAGVVVGQDQEVTGQIIISGTVTGGQAGIVNQGSIGSSNEEGNKGGITVSEGGSITSSSGGSGIVNQGNGSITGEIKVESGGNIEGGITNTGSGTITGDIKVEEGGKLESITNTSNSETGISGSITNSGDNNLEISNSGNIGGKVESTGSGSTSISNSSGGNITGGISSSGSGSTSIKNEEGGKIDNGITVSGGGKVDISNSGTVGKDSEGNTVKVEDSSSNVNIKDWVVSTDKDGNLDKVVVGGSGANNVKVDNITVDQSGLDLGKLENIDNIITGVDKNNVSNVGVNGNGELNLVLDPSTGKLLPAIQTAASVAAAASKSLVTTTTRRTIFIDNVVGNVMQSFSIMNNSSAQKLAMSDKNSLFASANDIMQSDITSNGAYNKTKEHSIFVLPYKSFQYVDLGIQGISKGHTEGIIAGYATIKDSGVYGLYIGKEKTTMGVDNSSGEKYFDVDNQTYYAGLKYFTPVYSLLQNEDVFVKVHSKIALIKNDLQKYIGKNTASANPNSYAYGLTLGTGINYAYGNNIFTPEFALGYEGGYTEAYSMEGAAALKHERYYVNKLNLFNAQGSFSWYRDWLPNIKTVLQAGYKFAINPTVESTVNFGTGATTGESKLNRWNEFLGASVIIPLNDAFFFSLNYNGSFAKNGQTHTGYAQFNYAW